MKRTTQRTPNPNKTIYKQYAETQLTLEEILNTFKDYTIYSVLDNTSIYIIADGKSIILFDSIGYDDDECVPTLYETYPMPYEDFDNIAHHYIDDCCKITKLN